MACFMLDGQELRERNELRLEAEQPATVKQCHTCERTLPTISSFSRTETLADGFHSNCRECYNGIARAKRAERQRLGVQPPRATSADERKCTACGEMKPCSAFVKNTGIVSGIRATCKKCRNAAFLSKKRAALASRAGEPSLEVA